MIKFENIEYLNFLYLIPILILIIILFSIWRRKKILEFTNVNLFKKLAPKYSHVRIKIKNIINTLIFIVLIIGIANPQIGSKIEEVKTEGIDIMIAFDVSNSMLAEDVEVSRLKTSRLSVTRLIDTLNRNRIGLVVFAGNAQLQLPLTVDYSAAQLVTSAITTNIISRQGTDISQAIELCVKSFDLNNNRDKAIIIFSDGGDEDENDHEQVISSAIDAAEKGIKIYTIGIGSKKGALIPIKNKKGELEGYIQNDKNPVISRLNENLLLEIAKKTSGKYIRANNSQIVFSEILNQIEKMKKQKISAFKITEYEDRFQWLIFISVFLLFLDLILLKKSR